MNAGPLCSNAALISGTSCDLSPEKLRATNEAPEPDRHTDEIDRLVELCPRPSRSLNLGRPWRRIAPWSARTPRCSRRYRPCRRRAAWRGRIAQAPRGRIPVAGDAQIHQFAVGEIGAGQHDGMRPCTELKPWLWPSIRSAFWRSSRCRSIWRFGGRQAESEAGVDDRRADRIVPAAGTERGHRAFVIATSVS